MKLMVGEILDLVAAADTEDKKINILRANYSPAMEDVLRWSHDPTIVFSQIKFLRILLINPLKG